MESVFADQLKFEKSRLLNKINNITKRISQLDTMLNRLEFRETYGSDARRFDNSELDEKKLIVQAYNDATPERGVWDRRKQARQSHGGKLTSRFASKHLNSPELDLQNLRDEFCKEQDEIRRKMDARRLALTLDEHLDEPNRGGNEIHQPAKPNSFTSNLQKVLASHFPREHSDMKFDPNDISKAPKINNLMRMPQKKANTVSYNIFQTARKKVLATTSEKHSDFVKLVEEEANRLLTNYTAE
jgi:hypothetical protein